MSARIIEGRTAAAEIRAELKQRVERLGAHGLRPGLAVVLVGNDPASESYVRGKTRGAEELGILSETIRPDASISQDALIGVVEDLNRDPRFHGIIVQLPLPHGLDERAVTEAVDPRKDVDGLHPVNLGRLLRGDGVLLPCTASGIQQLLVRNGFDPGGKHVVICGRSNLVGKPLAAILMQKAGGANATVTVAHTASSHLGEITRSADILVVAIGRARAITADMVRPGAVVIDVGVNRIADPSTKSGSRLVGDVDYGPVSEIATAITPVPGGVGPMTVTMLLANTVMAAETLCKRYT